MRFICRPGSASEDTANYSWGGIKMASDSEMPPVVLTITPDEFQQMESAVLDADAGEALRLLKKFVKRLKEQINRGLKSHLG
jgi:hypothetical protein